MRRIAIEEHFLTEDYLDYLRPQKDPKLEIVLEIIARSPAALGMVVDLGEGRLSQMDAAGIEMQVLSLSPPGVELSNASDAITLAKETNDVLSGVVRRYPNRFAGFAALPRHDPDEGARELERAVKELGLKGASVNSHLAGEYLDDGKYSVILEMAERLDVPIYIHPSEPSPGMIKPYLDYPELSGPLWGYGAEGGLHAMRLICSGVFDGYPGLKIILGHMGEAVPYWLWGMDTIWQRQEFPSSVVIKKLKKLPSQYIKDNFFCDYQWHVLAASISMCLLGIGG